MRRALTTAMLAAGALAGAVAALPAAASAELPSDLHYELVSPLESKGFDFTRAWLFADGDRGVIGSEVSDVNGVFAVRRTESGWERSYRRITSPNVTPLLAPATYAVSGDLARMVTGGVKPGSIFMTPNELALSEPDGGWKVIGGPLQFVGGDDGLERVVVQLGLGADRSELFPDFPGDKTDVFLWEDDGTGDGALTALGADVPRIVTCGADAPDNAGRRGDQSGVSVDARAVVLTSRAGCFDPDTFEPLPRHVYLWRDGEPTVDLSVPAAGPDADATFVGHGADFASIFLRTAAALDPADANGVDDVYRYDVASGESTRMTGAVTDDGGSLQSAIASADGGRLWFATVDGGDATLWVMTGEEPPVEIVTVSGTTPGETPFPLEASESGGRLPAQLTPDGDTLVWATSVEIDGVGGLARTGDVGQLFRATADGDALDCVSCTADGGPAASVDLGEVLMTLQLRRRAISDDGRWVYFQTETALEADDRNTLTDVYAWHDGDRSLIGSGEESYGSRLAGVSVDGDAFFTTYAQLMPWIDDDHLKVYAARHGDDLPAPRDPRESCVEDGCHGDPAPRVEHPRDPSETFTGPGDEDDPAPRFPANPSLRVARLSRAAQRKLAAGRAVTVAVRTNSAGRVTATTRFKAGRRWVRAGAAARTFKRAGSARLTLRLSRTARGRLARRGSLRVRVDVVHGQVAAPRRLAFVLKQPAPTRRGARA